MLQQCLLAILLKYFKIQNLNTTLHYINPSTRTHLWSILPNHSKLTMFYFLSGPLLQAVQNYESEKQVETSVFSSSSPKT